jgi:hypothetical protein
MIGKLLCRIGLHSWSYELCESGHSYPVCNRCGAWECWDGNRYERKRWPPPYPGFHALYRMWLDSRGVAK